VDRQRFVTRFIVPFGLIVGAVLGLTGSFVPDPSIRGLLWGLDGVALITATVLLTIHHLRQGNDLAAAGFLVFVVGETLILSAAALDLEASSPIFGAGVSLWATSLILVSSTNLMPFWIKVISIIAALLFAMVAIQTFMGIMVTPLSKPLPFFAYPFLVVALFGWAWVYYRNPDKSGSIR